MAKATKIQLHARIEEVVQLLLCGAEFQDIRQHAEKNNWSCSDRTIYRLIDRALEAMAPILERDRDKTLAMHVRQRRLLYARCLKIQDFKTAHTVLKDLAELQGLYPPKKVAPTNPAGDAPYDPSGLTDEQRAAEVARLLDIARARAAEQAADAGDGEGDLVATAGPAEPSLFESSR